MGKRAWACPRCSGFVGVDVGPLAAGIAPSQPRVASTDRREARRDGRKTWQFYRGDQSAGQATVR
jgi:hypothetical protein